MNVTIDGTNVTVEKGATVLEAARSVGIYIPALCSHPNLPSSRKVKPFEAVFRGTEEITNDSATTEYDGCQLCLVKIDGIDELATSCTTEVTEGMVVHTNTPEIQEKRRENLKTILAEHPNVCLACDRKEECDPFRGSIRKAEVVTGCEFCPNNFRCELQDVAAYIGVDPTTPPYEFKNLPVVKHNPFFERNYNLCIACTRCVRACQDVRGNSAIGLVFQNGNPMIGSKAPSLEESGCQFCGACVDVCPTGALTEWANKWEGVPETQVVTTCPYCGVGCQLELQIKKDRIIGVNPKADGTVNDGQACVKGKFGISEYVHHPERLRVPLIKRDGDFEEATWDEALDMVAERMGAYNPQEVAVISSAKCTNEENYVAQKFARAVLGTNNVDHCARLCHASTVAGLAQCFGAGAMTNSIDEISHAKCILAIGTNTTYAHPVIGMMVRQATRDGTNLIVANPREIELVQDADLYLQQNPGSDVALLMGMMRVIVDEDLHDKAFIEQRCENFEEFADSLGQFDLERTEEITGVPKEMIVKAARLYATNKPSSILYAMGITQHSHGTDNVIATANLAMLTGNVGKPSTGVNPLRGQNNVQGACDLGALPNVYTGYQVVVNDEIRKKFEDAWGTYLPREIGLTLLEILEAAHRKEMKALYLIGENPILSDPDACHAQEALEALDFFVVQDIFMSETAQLADVVLPSASFAEKDGTFTNTDRRVQRVRKVIEPIGDAKADWWTICQIAQRMDAKGFDFEEPSQIMEEIRTLTPSYAGITYERLESGGIQWPCPTVDHPGTPFLHAEKFTRGKGRFIPLEYRPPAELPDDDYPLILTTERSRYHFHTGTMTRKVAGLDFLDGEGMVEINPADASRLGIDDGEMVKVLSRRGEITARARVTEVSPAKVVTMNFHFAESPTNQLTNPALDPVAKIPEFKVCAVRVEKI
ncbi:MAG: formate dehydrogenase subunit alpha [Deltaproteobacteria bacterium]|nr:formate dehydrogenase subunit alpha [Deltaproteobacteria bacterium]